MFHHHRSVSSCGDHGDPGKAEKRKGSTANALQFPFLRRHDPDQVDKGSAQCRLSAAAHPSEEIDFLGEFKTHVKCSSSNVSIQAANW